MTQNTINPNRPERTIKKETKESVNHSSRTAPKKPKASLSRILGIGFVVILFGCIIWAVISNDQAAKETVEKLKAIKELDSTTYEEVNPKEFETVIEDSLKLEAEIAAKVESLAMAEKSGKPVATVAEKAATPSKSLTQPVVKPVVTTAPKQAVTPIAKPAVKTVGGVTYPVYITMGQGDMLTQFALKYYGHKAFWVYIYLANKNEISDPDHIPLGTKLRIPKPDPSRINANDPNSIATAKALQTKILSMK